MHHFPEISCFLNTMTWQEHVTLRKNHPKIWKHSTNTTLKPGKTHQFRESASSSSFKMKKIKRTHTHRWVWCQSPGAGSALPLANSEADSAPSDAKQPADVWNCAADDASCITRTGLWMWIRSHVPACFPTMPQNDYIYIILVHSLYPTIHREM